MTLDRRKEKVTDANAQVVTFVAITWIGEAGRMRHPCDDVLGKRDLHIDCERLQRAFLLHIIPLASAAGIHAPCIAASLINRNSLFSFIFRLCLFNSNISNIIKERDAALSDAMRSGMGFRESC